MEVPDSGRGERRIMTGLMYPKKPKKKRRRRHGKSIMHVKDGTCYICMDLNGIERKYATLHRHHIFGGPNRWKSEEDGLFVWLCLEHHELGKEAVHKNAYVMRRMHEQGQKAYEKIHSRREFMDRYGRNYLE